MRRCSPRQLTAETGVPCHALFTSTFATSKRGMSYQGIGVAKLASVGGTRVPARVRIRNGMKNANGPVGDRSGTSFMSKRTLPPGAKVGLAAGDVSGQVSPPVSLLMLAGSYS